MSDRILTTHVGSLVRPPELVEHLVAIEAGLPYDAEAHAACLRASVAEVVRQQVEAGVDIVSDGEFSKTEGWAAYINARVAGFTMRAADEAERRNPLATLSAGQDWREFPEFYAEYFPTQNFKRNPVPTVTVCTGPIAYTGQEAVQRDIENLRDAVRAAGATAAFLPVVAPASAFPTYLDEHYGDDRALMFAVADALRVEYQMILDAGLLLQVDDAFLPWTYERIVPPLSMDEYLAWGQLRIDALSHALRGLPAERIRYHICWGSWNAPHVHDVPLADIVDLLLQLNVGGYQFEAANVRHEHEWRVWQEVGLPDDKVLIPGVVSHVTNVVEHPRLIADRLERFAAIVGRDRVMAGTDCGFAQGPFTRRVHPTIQWAKLRSQAEGARLATAELWS